MILIVIAKSVLLLFLLIISFAILFASNFIFEVIYLSTFSLIMALLYLVMKAPDVAITEAAVGACITTLLLLWTEAIINSQKQTEQRSSIKAKITASTNIKDREGRLAKFTALIVISATAGALFYCLPELPQYGSFNAPANNEVYKYYLENTESKFGFPNVVTAILAGFRGYDTLGETFVIFTAAISILFLLKNIKD